MNSNQVRIIGGKWRGKKLKFPDIETLRPTPDAVRETLFNWLMQKVHGSTCLDLFAGSGAIGFEALSRGAKHVVMVDNNKAVVKQLIKNVEALKVDNVTVIQASAPENISLQDQAFDLIFLDPPFNKGLVKACCDWVVKENLMNENTLIYIEAEKGLKPLPIPNEWEILKSKVAGEVAYFLIAPVITRSVATKQ